MILTHHAASVRDLANIVLTAVLLVALSRDYRIRVKGPKYPEIRATLIQDLLVALRVLL